MPVPIVRPGRRLPFIENTTHLNQHADNWTQLVTERLNRASLVAENTVEVFELSDLPAPVDCVIRLEDNTLYSFKAEVLDVGCNQIMQGTNTWMDGQKDGLTEIRGTTTVPLFVTNGTSGFKADSLTLNQQGSGELIRLNSTTNGSSFKLVDCEVIGGDIRLMDGLVFIADELLLDERLQVIQDSSGGVPTIIFENISVIFGLPFGSGGLEGIIKFEAGSSTTSFRYIQSDVAIFNDATAIFVESGASISSFVIQRAAMTVFGTGGTLLKVGNPNDITEGLIEDSSVTLLGANDRFLVCDPTSSETLAATSTTAPVGMTQNGDGDLIVSDPGTNMIVRYVGISNTFAESIPSPSTNVGALAWFAGDLYSVDTGTNLIYKHAGFTTSTTSIASPASNVSGIVFVGSDLVSSDSVTNLIYVHDGSSTTTSSFASPATTTMGLGFDGVNLLIGDTSDNTIYVMRNITATTQYSFVSASATQEDIWVTFDSSDNEVGFSVVDSSSDEIHLYDHPVTFDHSSASWEIMGIPGIVSSSDRGGVQFTDATRRGVDTDIAAQWYDISDDGVDIFYGVFSESEKMVVNNEESGEILWLATRDRARTITGQVTFSRGGPNADVEYEISISINDVVQKDSITFGIIPTSTAVLTMGTLPISRDLVKDDTIKIQIRRNNAGASSNPEIGFSKVAIT